MFFLVHTFISRFKPEGLPLTDGDVAEAVGALATSFETASRGVLYEGSATSANGEALRRELKAFVAQMTGEHGPRVERELAIVLRGIERGAKHESPGIGTGPVAYLTLVARLLHERPPDVPSSASRIILP